MGEIYLFTGPGGGKTTNALGLALRSIGHDHKVIIIQFLKWWTQTGEYKVQEKLAPLYEIHQFGRKGWIGLENLTDDDRKLVRDAMEFTEKAVKEKNPNLLVLDELNLAAHCNLVPMDDIIAWLERLKQNKNMTIAITGRHAPEKLLEIADYVNIIEVKKIPKQFGTTKGIQW